MEEVAEIAELARLVVCKLFSEVPVGANDEEAETLGVRS